MNFQKNLKRTLGFFSPEKDPLFFRRALALSFVFHFLASVYSVGYQAADEQFQILEFLSYKLGVAPAKDLAVEFSERMRPWLQPGIYWVIVKIFQFFGIFNPHIWAIGLRFLTGLLGWWSALALASCSLIWFRDSRTQKWAIAAISFIWYFPVLHVRPSSESLAGSAFTLGLCILFAQWHREKKGALASRSQKHFIEPSWLLGGIFLGLSFEARFQMGFMILGAVAWFFWVGKLPLKKLLIPAAGVLLVFLLGRWVDHWAYGDWSFSPWNYFSYNILRGEVSRYGRAPWWDIFRMSVTESWPILGLLMALACVVAWVRHPKHILTWSLVPFFIIHEMIAHKEYRFYFPIASMAPVLLILSLCSTKAQLLSLPKSWPSKRVFQCIILFLILNNFVGLLASSLVPMARTVQFQEAVYDQIPQGSSEFHLYTQNRDPFEILGNPIYFYRPSALRVHRFKEDRELLALGPSDRPFWLFDPHFDLGPERAQSFHSCQQVFRTLPHWVIHLNWYDWLSRANVWALYRCD